LPELQATLRERPDAALVTVVVSGQRQSVDQVVARTGLRAPVLVDVPAPRAPGSPGDRTGSLRTRYGIDQVPWTLVIDRTGHGVEVIIGARNSDGFVRALDRAEKQAQRREARSSAARPGSDAPAL